MDSKEYQCMVWPAWSIGVRPMLVDMVKGGIVCEPRLKMMGRHFAVSQWGVIRKHNHASIAERLSYVTCTHCPCRMPRERTSTVRNTRAVNIIVK